MLSCVSVAKHLAVKFTRTLQVGLNVIIILNQDKSISYCADKSVNSLECIHSQA